MFTKLDTEELMMSVVVVVVVVIVVLVAPNISSEQCDTRTSS